MGGTAAGPLNSSGFTASIKTGQLPHYEHITHAGIWNENFFEVGKKAKELFEIHHGLAISNCDLTDMPKRNFFISLFNKSCTDGQKRTRPINVVVALDVSGSMGGPLKNDPNPAQNKKNRLDLSRDAIWMLFEKLNPDDAFGFTTFHNTAKTIIKSTFVSELDKDQVKKMIYSQFNSGGTVIKEGFNESVKNLEAIRNQNPDKISNYEHRIVMLTDVCDNSVANQNTLIEYISNTQNINTTIIGVSTDFQSKTCEKMIETKGFNYFCAVENSDLQTYLADQFDYTFFPCVQNVQIDLESQFIESIKVYGTPDHKTYYPRSGNTFVVTKMKSGFPSDLITNKQGQIETKGGLMLVKFQPKNPEKLVGEQIMIKINLKYEDLSGKIFRQTYGVQIKVMAQEFYSDGALEKGTRLWYYTQTMRNLLKAMTEGEGEQERGGSVIRKEVLSDSNRGMYAQKLEKLRQYCPHDKKDELERVIDIVEDKRKEI